MKTPQLPCGDREIDIPAQPCPYIGERTIKLYIRFPGGSIEQINQETGLMLSLHNWGGTGFIGTADPELICDRYNVICIGVDYLQSGESAPPSTGHPYDTGYLQTLDALRGLYFVYNGLRDLNISFDTQRIYSIGGSGGGNISLMANKFAPLTFACIVDLSGLASLTDKIAFDSSNHIFAGYNRNPEHPNYLPEHAQEIRDTGNIAHLNVVKKLDNKAIIVTVHGVNDTSCLVDDKRRVLDNCASCGFDVHAHYITENDIDGELIKNAGHSIGDRTKILIHYADKFLKLRRQSVRCDFDCYNHILRFPVTGGEYLIDYTNGVPVGNFILHTSVIQ